MCTRVRCWSIALNKTDTELTATFSQIMHPRGSTAAKGRRRRGTCLPVVPEEVRSKDEWKLSRQNARVVTGSRKRMACPIIKK